MGLSETFERSQKARIIAIMSEVKMRLRRRRIMVGAGTDDVRFDGHAKG